MRLDHLLSMEKEKEEKILKQILRSAKVKLSSFCSILRMLKSIFKNSTMENLVPAKGCKLTR